jgi:hypothetical protein
MDVALEQPPGRFSARGPVGSDSAQGPRFGLRAVPALSSLTDGEEVLIPQSGSMLRRTHPTQYAAAISSFLRRRRVIRDSVVLPLQGRCSSAETW